MACCCDAAWRKLLAAAMDSESLSTGSFSLFAILSINVVDIEEARSSSLESRIRKAMERNAVSTSVGSLNDKTAEKRISASLFLEYRSLASIQPFFSSQEQASFTEVTGLTDAESCCSRSALGEKVRLPGAWLLLLAPRAELRGLFFIFAVSPIVRELLNGVGFSVYVWTGREESSVYCW